MKILISGAAGFLGRHFLRYFQDAKAEIVAFDIAVDRPEGVYHFEAQEFYESSRRQFDIAIHLAALVGGREKIEGDPLYNADSLRLDAAFFRWASEHAKLAIYPSSSAVYGAALQKAKGQALREDAFNPENAAWYAPDEMYGFTKLTGEYLAWKAAKYGLSTLCIRPFSGYGEGQAETYPIPAICKRALNQENPLIVWGSGQQSRDLIHVSDLVNATMARVKGGVNGYESMNIGTGIPIKMVEIAKMAAEIAGYAPQIVNDESKPEGVHSRFCDPSEMLRWYHPSVTVYDGLARVMQSLIRAHTTH